MIRKTKIVCTIGPASDGLLEQLINSGMNVARINMSHGSIKEHLQRIKNIRSAAEKCTKDIGILLDIQGPKIRLGEVKPDPLMVNSGEQIVLTISPCIGNEQKIYVNYPDLINDVKPQDVIYIDDGLIELKVVKIDGDDVYCKVAVGGRLGSRKGVTLPGIDVKLPPLTDEDIKHIEFGIANGIDFVAASFVRKASHVLLVKDIIKDLNSDTPVIAKIENAEGIRNIDEIIAVADGVMVARGDLGVEIPPEEIPLAQKLIIKKCNERGIPVITATQMLDSMMRNPRATRAEITDVANAIFDGTDAVMLSGETAIGKYPIKAVELMNKIAVRIEESFDYMARFEVGRKNRRQSIADAISLATCQTAHDLNVKAILCITQSGATARAIAKYRPEAPIIAVCPHQSVVNRLMLSWGVNPIVARRPENTEHLINAAVDAVKNLKLVKTGETVAITAGVRTGIPGSTNLLMVSEIE